MLKRIKRFFIPAKKTLIGHLDYNWTVKKRLRGSEYKINGRIALFVDEDGQRTFNCPHMKEIRTVDSVRGFFDIAQLLTWELGGHLPDDFVPVPSQYPERRNNKLPAGVRGQLPTKQEK